MSAWQPDFLLDPLQRDQMKIYRYSIQEEMLKKHEYTVDRMVDDLILQLSLDQKNELKQKILDFGLKKNYYQPTSMTDEMKFFAKKA